MLGSVPQFASAQQQLNKYNFNQVVKNVEKLTSNARWHTRGDAALGLFEGPTSLAMRFPSIDTDQRESGAVLMVDDSGRFNPGTRNVEIRVNIRLDESLADNGKNTDPTAPFYVNVTDVNDDASRQGMNIVQKGLFSQGGQWKLQIDPVAGRNNRRQELACSDAPPANFDVPHINIFDGDWKFVKCEKDESSIKLTVDGVSNTVPANLGSVENDADVHIGGRIQSNGLINDQFHGDMDNLNIDMDP